MEKELLNSQVRNNLHGEFIELADGYTHYELKGVGNSNTVVLIHGNIAPLVSWDNTFYDLVSSGFEVLRYDLFGHGFSDRPHLKKYTKDLYDRQLIELLDKLKISESVFMIGTSQGGSICAYFAAKHIGRVKKLALLAPFFDSFESSRNALILKARFLGELIIPFVVEKKILNLSASIISDEKRAILACETKKQLNYEGKNRAILANLRGDALNDATPYYEEVRKQGLQVLLTWGSKDKTISSESMNRLRALIPEIEYHEIKSAGHLAHYEFPEQVNPLLIRFLTE